MTYAAAVDVDDARRVALIDSGIVGGKPERVLALAWIRLAGPIAPPGTAITHRITVLAPIRLRLD